MTKGYQIETLSQKRDRLTRQKTEVVLKNKAIHTDVARNYHPDLYRDNGKDCTPNYRYRGTDR